MKSSIISIGNSKGVRIPKTLLEESGIRGEVEIKAKKGEIKIVSVKPKRKKNINEEYLLSLGALGDWDTPEEDKAWEHLNKN